MPRPCPDTMDLLTWEPQEFVERFEESAVRAASLRTRIAKAVSETLRSSDLSRQETARRMSDWLGEEVSKHILDAYASEARDAHTIPYIRLLALVQVTGDVRLLQVGAEIFGRSVIDDRYLDWIEVGQLSEHKDAVGRALDAARRRVRRSR